MILLISIGRLKFFGLFRMIDIMLFRLNISIRRIDIMLFQLSIGIRRINIMLIGMGVDLRSHEYQGNNIQKSFHFILAMF